MISYVKGPGGFWRRLAAEFVPFCIALTLGWVAAALHGLEVGVGVGVVTWLLASFALRAVRRHPVLRTLYRLALVAHVGWWSWQGIEASREIRPEASTGSQSSAWSKELPFSAGFGEVAFDLPPSATLAGWGSRPRRVGLPPFGGFGPIGRRVQAWMAGISDGGPRHPLFHAPEAGTPAETLGARALVFRPQGEARPAAIVRLDLVTSDADLAEAIQGGVADLGFRPESVVVVATHTHSGPGGYAANRVSALVGTDHFDPACFDAIRDAAIDAIRAAHDSAVPAHLGMKLAHDAGSENLARLRGDNVEDVALDDRVYALHVVRADDRKPIATLVQYAVHPTLVRRQHMNFARDLVGALEDQLSEQLAGNPPVLFVNGALGDVAPQGRHGSGPEAAVKLATDFGRVVTQDLSLAADDELSTHLQLTLVQRHVTLDRAALLEGVGDRLRLEKALQRPLGEGDFGHVAADVVALPANVLLWSFGMTHMRVGWDWHRAAGVRVGLPSVPSRRSCGAWTLSHSRGAGKGAPQRASLLWFPAEATTALGRDWRGRVGDDEPTLILGLANGSMAYVTTPAEFAAGGYEGVASVHGSGAGRALGEALWAALEEARRLRWR